MNSIVKITLLVLACLTSSANGASCNACNNGNQRVNPALHHLVHTIQDYRLGGSKQNWSCRELENWADAGNFNNNQCNAAHQIATRYCGCGATSSSDVQTNDKCGFCSGKNVNNRNKFVNTFMGSNALTCGELMDGDAGQYWTPATCTQFKNNNVEGQCCSSVNAAPGVGLFGCFSGENMVNVQDKGQVRMDQIKIGDMIAVGEGKVSRVYSFGHHDTESMTEYLQIHAEQLAKPLEITKEHMIFVEGAGAVPASIVSVGDSIVLTEGTASVTKVSKVSRKGAYAPFTEAGELVVSDVLASSFISVIEDASSLTVGGVEVASLHWLAHAFEAPHRVVCKMSPSFCESETYTPEGISHWVNGPFNASLWLMDQNVVVQALLSIAVMFACTTLYLLEFLLTSSVALTCIAGLIVLASKRCAKSKHALVQ